ncbi:MAG TPA: PilZ domain-containing protein [Terriglobales bacterium]|nr:PilZ domain-containing protein [Terriglobales bacterium]
MRFAELIAAERPVVAPVPRQQRRRAYRLKIQTLAYVNLDHANGGVIRDLTSTGMAVQAVSPLRPEQPVHVRFDLLGPRLHIEVPGRVVWAEPSGRAGIEFLNLPRRSARLLKDWLLTQLLASAHQVQRTASVFQRGPAEGAPNLRFSTTPRPAIALRPNEIKLQSAVFAKEPQLLHIPWCPIPIASSIFSRSVDGLILVAAVLLFSTVSLVMTQRMPAWPIAFALMLGSTAIFSAAYWTLFTFWMGTTPGAYLAQLAGAQNHMEEEEQPRFR